MCEKKITSMKSISAAEMLILSLIFSFSVANANEDDSASNQWQIKPDKESVRYVTNGRNVFGHEFGFIKNRKHCDADVMWVSWSSYSKAIKQYEGSNPILEFQTSKITLRFDLTYLTTANLTPELSILVFTNFLANEKLISLLESEKKVIVRVVHPEDFVKKFDIAEDSFDLSGFKAARIKATDACQTN